MNKKKTSYIDVLLNIVKAFFIIFAICLVFVTFFFISHSSTLYNISGKSMLPTLSESGSKCYVNNLNKNFKYGDIIVAKNSNNENIIKRVIGLGGDKIGFIEVNGEVHIIRITPNSVEILFEDYISSINDNKITRSIFLANQKNNLEEYTFLGQTIKVLPILQNQMFWLGDNRANSYDCSYYGAQSTSLVLGKADLIIKEGESPLFKVFLYQIGFGG